MEMKGEYVIPADRQTVWEALNDPEVLKECIPGCQSLEKVSDTEMTAVVQAKVGPVKATFKGNVTLENLNPPESYTISGEGKGGVAGFAKGGADVSLAETDGGTRLSYEVTAQIGGKLAQLGSRLVNSTAKKYAEDFFSSFSKKVGGEEPEGGSEASG
ncbi:carbon monoxide dehydrogenase subunit G [Amorphus sp. 3PC139-8]|uniref:SRPBCC family protein n=1 Tax=Amorphus sp. 3PC139-8 TaxID=2735676 RepID=UPI00345CB67B